MRGKENISDEILLANLKKGNRIAFEEIYLKYWASVYKRVRHIEIAEEVVQDFFVYLWEKRNDIGIHTSFESYIHTAVRYQVLNYLQKKLTRNNYKVSLLGKEAYTNEVLVYVELNNIIEEEISQLPEKCQVSVVTGKVSVALTYDENNQVFLCQNRKQYFLHQRNLLREKSL